MRGVAGNGIWVGIGSNIEPLNNVPAIVRHLLAHFPRLHISPVLHTEPQGMNTNHDFLNAVAFIETERPADEVKAIFNSIEETLGRDRSHPQSKQRDRAADIDILHVCQAGSPPVTLADLPHESYLRGAFCLLAGALGALECRIEVSERRQRLSLDGQLFGEAATTIDRDGDTCRVVVIE